MNARSVIEYLRCYLAGILYHDLFFNEFVDLIVGSGRELSIFRLLVSRLKSLNSYGTYVTNIKEFENIGGGLFSIHLTGTGFNIRILFAFLPNGQPILLHAFYERQGKGRTNYSSHIDPAQSRFAEKLEDYKNGRI